jgi:hypothetical protein
LSSTPAKSGCDSLVSSAAAGATLVAVSGIAVTAGVACCEADFAAQGAVHPPLGAAQAQPTITIANLARINNMRYELRAKKVGEGRW